jgi:ABC-type sulfate transport system permease subunit
MFELTPGHVYFFSKNCCANPLHLQYFEFIGKIFGLSLIHSSYYISPTLSKLIYKLLLDEKIDFDDVSEHYDSIKFKEEKEHL